MMWRRVDLVHSFLPLVCITTFWCVVFGQSNIDGPCHTCPAECIGRQRARYWWRTMWGFIVTMVALTMDVWGYEKALSESTILNVLVTFFLSALNPLFILWEMLEFTFVGMAMLGNLGEALGNDVITPTYPWSKSHNKVIVGSVVIVNLSPDVYKDNHNLNAFEEKVLVKDLSEALVIGTKVVGSEQYNVQLDRQGELALLRSNVLLPYDELKFLRGNSSLGMAIASAQAMGYIYGVVVRSAQGLRVSLIEAIAFVLNIVILMKGVLHNFASIGHRPLFLYLLPAQEEKLIEECKNTQYFKFKVEGRIRLIGSITCGILLAMGAYFIFNFVKSLSRTCIVPIILFEVSIVLGGILGLIMRSDSYKNLGVFLICLPVLLNTVGYVWALFLTFKFWKAEEFDVQSSNYLSQVLPYIG